MESAILNAKSKTDLKLIINLASKLGIKSKILSSSEIEDISMINAIRKGKSGHYTETQSFLKKLRK
jgi:hypothetical protein